jgi:ribosome recycling factor
MIREVISETKLRMKKTIDDFGHELTSIRTGKASVHLLDGVKVDYYGTPTPLNQVATIHAPDASTITLQPFDASQIKVIEKAIMSSRLGLNPNNDGRIIRIPIPSLTEDRRKEMAKQVGKIAEDHRNVIRKIRRDSKDQLKSLEKSKEISEDQEYTAFDEVQKLTDDFIQQIDSLGKAKEQDILQG